MKVHLDKSPDNQVLAFTGVLVLLMLATANCWGVVETSEARYAEISREMVKSGDWLHPMLLNIYHYHKPPATYWITGIAYSFFGFNSFGTRVFLIVSYGAQVFLIFKLTQHLFNDRMAAGYAAIVYATLPIVLISARGLTTDSYLCTFVLLSVYCWIMFLKTKRVYLIYGMATALGVAFMTKGPVAFVVPGFALTGSWKRLPIPRVHAMHICMASLLFVVVGFSWFGFLISEDGRFADYFFFHHFVDRIAHAEVFARKEPWYYYLLILPAVFLPWSVFFFARLFQKWAEPGRRLARSVVLWWFLLPLVLFSLSTSKLVLYILPLSIGFSMVTGHFLAQGVTKRLYRFFLASVIVMSAGLIAITTIAPGLNTNVTLIIAPLMAGLVSLAARSFEFDPHRMIRFVSVLFSATVIIFSAELFKLNAVQINSIKPLSSFIEQNNLRERSILVYDELLPSLAFELDKDIISLYAGNRSLKRETQFETNQSWKNYLIDTTDSGGVKQMQSLLSKKCVLIVNGDVPPPLTAVMAGVWQKEAFGKWIVYYN